MKRRNFITLVAGAVAWPGAARAQRPVVPVAGFLHPSTVDRTRDVVAAFEDGLKRTGYTLGENIAIEYRWADDNYDRLPELTRELVRRQVAVILAATPVAALAAKRVASEIPIVFCVGSDPVKDGLVTNIARPTGNITGTTFFADLLSAKRLGLLQELVRGSNRFGVMFNPKNPNTDLEINDANEAAQSLGLDLVFASAEAESEIDKSFIRLTEGPPVGGLLIASDAFLNLHAKEIAKLALQYRLPTCFSFREPAAVGGLVAYGASRPDAYRRAGNYLGRILHGEKPSNLPIEQPTKFELVINLKTATALGVTIPNSMQLLADEMIE
jgi:putative ABC transport system substrate-binding protein